MSNFRSHIAVAVVVGALLPRAVQAQAGTYFLDALDPNNGFEFVLSAGIWNIGVVDGGWSPWNYVQGCDGFGANCQTGFHTIFYYYLGASPLTPWGIDGSQFATATTSDFYATPELALMHAFPPLQLDIATPTTFEALIPDCCYADNSGGLTIQVAQVVTPEPASLSLAAIGLLGLAVTRRKRRAL